ncbi:MAG: HAMP domain-containing histidine kinase [Epsilonproteobacteria bacterium]|nr:HAMP domain-containing histidine kinase [Campylobacterota bacterium]
MNDNSYAFKYAWIYTGLITVILLTPLFFYTVYMKKIHEIQNELFLKEKSLLIVKYMEEFNQNESYFEYPRFKTFRSGLYDMKFQPIFTLVENRIDDFKEGYHVEEGLAYIVVRLPKNRYFGAEYLLVENKLSYASVYEKVMIILFSIVILVFFLSLLFLNRFAKPFQLVNERLDNFIKDSIHEINTPLSIINVNIDLYNRKHQPNKYMRRMKAAAKVLSNIYNDMDYLIKYDRLDFEVEEIDMASFVKERIEYFSEVANMKEIELISSIQEGITLHMNHKQFGRVVDNNLSNAIKYSNERSKIEVELFMSGQECYLSFQDEGIGIENVDKIFHRYYREDTQRGGFGIGLNIVKSIIDSQGIELKIESEPKKGSRFTYIFPAKIITQ